MPRLVGVSKAKEMIFTGRMITGTEAAEIGLADYAVVQNENGDAAYQRALALAEEILPRGPVAVRMAKLSINRGMQVRSLLSSSLSGRSLGSLRSMRFSNVARAYWGTWEVRGAPRASRVPQHRVPDITPAPAT